MLEGKTALLPLMLALSASAATVRPTDDGRALCNPGMGWMQYCYGYDETLDPPGDDLRWFPGCSVCYLRIPWSMLEPREGDYNWALLDTPAQRMIARGGQIAIRVVTSTTAAPSAVPQWVWEAGAQPIRWNFKTGPASDGKFYDPNHTDPIFRSKLENFLTAMARRYDGRKEVAYLDIGTFGLWGEGHTLFTTQTSPAERLRDARYHIDLHCRLFPRTQLVVSDDIDDPFAADCPTPILDYARSKGVAWRDDSILVHMPPKAWFHAGQAECYWRSLPVVLECDHYPGHKKNGTWVPDLLYEAVESMHASYMSIHGHPREFYEDHRDVIDRVNRRIGYRFQLREATWPDEVHVKKYGRGKPFKVSMTWANAGVAPCYRDAFPCLTVKDSSGGIVGVLADGECNLRNLKVAAPGRAEPMSHEKEFFLGVGVHPLFPRGEFDVFVSVGEADGTPIYELPLPESDGQRRYRIGRIRYVD